MRLLPRTTWEAAVEGRLLFLTKKGPVMSIFKTTIAAAAILISTGAVAAPIMDEAQYAKNVTEYSKELVAAAFAARWCGEYHVAVNEKYFNLKSPGVLWDKKRFDDYSESVMLQMRKKIDAIYARVGHEEYCKGYMEFAKKNRTFYGMAIMPADK
jgi:hypothetical protein